MKLEPARQMMTINKYWLGCGGLLRHVSLALDQLASVQIYMIGIHSRAVVCQIACLFVCVNCGIVGHTVDWQINHDGFNFTLFAINQFFA